MTDVKLNYLYYIAVLEAIYQTSSGLLKNNVTYKLFKNHM